jgi:hypothetical protein
MRSGTRLTSIKRPTPSASAASSVDTGTGRGEHKRASAPEIRRTDLQADRRVRYGQKGFPIHPLFPPAPEHLVPASDCNILRDVAHGRTWRARSDSAAHAQPALNGFNKEKIDVSIVAQVERGETQSMIGFNGPLCDDDLRPLCSGFPPENFAFDRINQQDIDRLAASGANNQGLGNENADTATEASIIARATETRLANERNAVLGWLVRGCAKLLGLIQLTARDEQLVELVGPDGAQQFATWNREDIQGEFGFSVKPDSSVRLDAAQEREKVLRLYNLAANSPFINHAELLKVVVSAFGFDPSAHPAAATTAAARREAGGEHQHQGRRPQPDDAAVHERRELLIWRITLAAAGRDALRARLRRAARDAAAGAKPVSKHDANLTGKPVGAPVPGAPPPAH